ncbi:MAG: hypothetical protein RIT81_03380, partial [Deltaproteobacteria bacterium]
PSPRVGQRQAGPLAAPADVPEGAPPRSRDGAAPDVPPNARQADVPEGAPTSPRDGQRQAGSLAAPADVPPNAQRHGGSNGAPDAPANAQQARGRHGAPPLAGDGQQAGAPEGAPPRPRDGQRTGGSLGAPPSGAQRSGESSSDLGASGSDVLPPPATRAPFADLAPPKSAWDDLADTVKRESGPPPLAPVDDAAWADLAEAPAPSDAAPLPDSAFLEPPSAPGGRPSADGVPALPESARSDPGPNSAADDLAALPESAVADPPTARSGLPPNSAADDLPALPESAFADPPTARSGLPQNSAADDLAALPESAFADPPARSGLPPPSATRDLAPPSRLPSAVTDDLLPPAAPPDDEDDDDEELLLTEDDVVSSQSTPVPDDAPFAALLDGARGKLPPFPPPAGTPAHGTAMPEAIRREEPSVEYPTVRPRAEEWTDAEDETPAVQTPDLRRSAVTLAPDLTHSPSKVEATISPLGGAPAAPAPKRPTTRRPASFAGRKIRETSRAPKSRPASNASNPRAEPYFTRGLAALEAGDLVSAERDLAIAMTYAPSIERYRAAFAELKRRKGR